MENKKTIFHVKYDGPALTSNEMNVKDLAPALLAIGELLEEANDLLNERKTRVSVNIKATEEGSVDIVLSVIQDFWNQTVSLFDSDDVNAIVNAKELLGIVLLGGVGVGTSGLVGLLKWLKNRPIKNVTKLEAGEFKIELNDGEIKVCNEKEIKLFRTISIRKKVEAFVKTPLLKNGVESVTFSENKERQIKITKEESDYFIAPDVKEEVINEQEIETNLTMINVSFQKDGKWKFSDGANAFFAGIEDEEFVEKVQRNQIVFAKDDILKVILGIRQFILDGNMKAEYVIKKVLNHRSAAAQIKLPFSNKE